MKHIFIMILFLFAIGCSDCSLSSTNCFEEYTFTIDFTISPALDTFQIGDTIWISSTIPEQLKNEETDELVNISDVNFPFLFSVDKVDTTDFAPIEDNFEYFYKTGSLNFQEVGSFSRIFLSYTGNQEKSIEFGIIPQKTSVVLLSFYWRPPDVEDIKLSDCIEEISFVFNTNNSEDNNYHIVAESNNPLLEIEKDDYNLFGNYAFVVVE